MHAVTSITSLLSAAVLLVSSASASSLSVPPSHLRFRRAATAVVPTSPGPGQTFNEGATCLTEWTAGSGSAWKSMTISLMTGSNEAMQVLKVVGSDIDGTTQTSLSFTCPDVTPNSAIYFYQFTDKNSANPTWTTRFTIASANGASTTPTNSEQSDGETVMWGTGSLASSDSSSSSSSNSTSPSSSSSSSSTSSSDDTSAATSTASDSSSYTLTTADNASTTAASSFPTTSSSSSSSFSNTSTSGSTSSQVVYHGLLFSAASLAAAVVLL